MLSAATVLVPFVAAALLAALPEALRRSRLHAAIRSGGAILALAAAGLLAIAGPIATPWLGRAAGPFVILLADTLALAAATGTARPPAGARRGRLHDAAVQAVSGGVALAALAADPVTVWAATLASLLLLTLGGLAPGSSRRERLAARQALLIGGGCLLLALVGAVLLDHAAATITDPGTAPLREAGGLLMLAGFAGFGLLAPMLRRDPGHPAEGLADADLVTPALAEAGLVSLALAVPLRLQAEPGLLPDGMLLTVGLAGLLVAATAIWVGRPTRSHDRSVVALCAASLAGFGLGSAVGAVAGLLLLASTLLADGACRLVATSAAKGPLGRVTQLARAPLHLVPPFGPFAAGVLLLFETVLQVPLAALPLALGLAGVALRRDRRSDPPVAGSTGRTAVWTALTLLALCLALGLLVPPGIAGWLATATRTPG